MIPRTLVKSCDVPGVATFLTPELYEWPTPYWYENITVIPARRDNASLLQHHE
jgi:hypothetical protein